MRVRVVISAALLCAGLSGCGSDGKAPAGSDQAAIIDVARAVATTDVSATLCRTRLSDDFVRTVFGNVDTCASAGGRTQIATAAAVRDIAVDGDSATAVVTDEGGAEDGASGTWAFVRDAGGWRVAEWRIDYLRADFRARFGAGYHPDGEADPFADPAVRSCVSDKLQGLADPEFRTTAYEILRQSDVGNQALQGWFYDCVGGSTGGGVSALRRIFEDGLRQTDRIPPDVVECVVAKLRTTVSDAEIRAMGRSGAGKTPASVEKRISSATVTCVDQAARKGKAS